MTVINMYKKKITTDEFIKLIVDKELELVGAPIRYDDLIGNEEKYPHWYQDYSFKLDEYLEWKKFYFDHFYDWKPKREKDIQRYLQKLFLHQAVVLPEGPQAFFLHSVPKNSNCQYFQ